MTIHSAMCARFLARTAIRNSMPDGQQELNNMYTSFAELNACVYKYIYIHIYTYYNMYVLVLVVLLVHLHGFQE